MTLGIDTDDLFIYYYSLYPFDTDSPFFEHGPIIRQRHWQGFKTRLNDKTADTNKQTSQTHFHVN